MWKKRGSGRGRYLAGGQVAFFTTAPLKEQSFRDYTKTQRSLLYSLICSARWINPSIFAARVARRVSSSSLSLFLVSTSITASSSTASVCSGLFTDIVTDVSPENPRPSFARNCRWPVPGFPILPRFVG